MHVRDYDCDIFGGVVKAVDMIQEFEFDTVATLWSFKTALRFDLALLPIAECRRWARLVGRTGYINGAKSKIGWLVSVRPTVIESTDLPNYFDFDGPTRVRRFACILTAFKGGDAAVNLFFNVLKEEDVERLTAGWTFRAMLDYELGLMETEQASPWHDLVDMGFYTACASIDSHLLDKQHAIFLSSHRGQADIYASIAHWELSLTALLFEWH